MNEHDDVEAFVLGALDPDEVAAFEAHLATCSACRDEVASYAPVMNALRSVPVLAPPPVPKVRRPRASWWLPAGAAALAAAVVLAIVDHNAVMRADPDVVAVAQMVAGNPRQLALHGDMAHGSVIVGDGGQRTAFVIEGLPPAPASHGYQVWVRGAATRSPGMLHRTADGLEILVVDGDLLAGTRKVGVTIEPAGGSPMRTGEVQVSGDVI